MVVVTVVVVTLLILMGVQNLAAGKGGCLTGVGGCYVCAFLIWLYFMFWYISIPLTVLVLFALGNKAAGIPEDGEKKEDDTNSQVG